MIHFFLRLMGLYLNILAYVAPKKASTMGFDLFTHPFRPSLTEKQKNYLEAAQYSRIHHADQFVQTYTWGRGPVKILFVHGWQSHSYRWKPFIDALDPDKYTIYALDAPGHGLSEGRNLTVPLYGEILEIFLREIGAVDCLVGHSLGSFTALYTLYHKPELMPKRMVSLASPGSAEEFFSFYQKYLALSTKTLQLITDRFIQFFYKKPSYFSSAKFAEVLEIPGLIMHDWDDEDTPVQNSINLQAAWKGSELILTKGAGHNLRLQMVVDKVVGFIEALEIQSPYTSPSIQSSGT